MTTKNHIFSKVGFFLLLLLSLVLPTKSFAQDTNPSIFFKTFGQSTGESLSFDNVKLDSIAVNNVKAAIADSGELTVYKDDAIRIAGRSNPGTHVTVMFGDRQIEAVADYGGDWFVLFSITNMVEGKYVVNAQAANSSQPIFLVNLIVGQGNRILEPSSNGLEDETKTDPNNRIYYLYIAITAIISIVFGWFLRIYFEKRRNKRKLH